MSSHADIMYLTTCHQPERRGAQTGTAAESAVRLPNSYKLFSANSARARSSRESNSRYAHAPLHLRASAKSLAPRAIKHHHHLRGQEVRCACATASAQTSANATQVYGYAGLLARLPGMCRAARLAPGGTSGASLHAANEEQSVSLKLRYLPKHAHKRR